MFKKLKISFKEKKLKKAFKTIKSEMNALESSHFALKHSTDEWIKYLMEKNEELSERVAFLENNFTLRENKQNNPELSLLRKI